MPVNSRRNFTEIQKFPGIPTGNLGSRESREFPGKPEWEFSMALVITYVAYRPSS